MEFREVRRIAWKTIAELFGFTEPTDVLTGASSTTFLRGDATWTAVNLSTAAVTGILPPANGGTGIANNASSTLTITGAFATTFTLSGVTSVTLPISGTLATLAGAEALTNKTYNGNTFTAGTGTLTIAAGKTATHNATTTFAGTDGQTLTINGSATITNGTHSGTNTGDQTNITGNAGTVTVANEATDTTCFPLFAVSTSGSLEPKTNSNMTFNSSTGVVTFASSVLTTTDINGGTVDGASIGASSASSGAFTTITATSDIGLAATHKYYFDGVALNGDTYVLESSANTLDFFVGGVKVATFASSIGTFPAGVQLSATAGDTALNRSKETTISSTASGPIANTATTLSVSRVGNKVTLTLPAVRVAGNSTATTIALSTLAAEYRPVTSVYSIVPLVTDNGSDQTAPGLMNVSTGGVVTIYKNVALNNFTSSAATTGYYGFSVTWLVA